MSDDESMPNTVDEGHESRMDAFRRTITTWKRESLNSFTENQQDATKLNSYLAKLTSLYFEFLRVLEGNRSSAALQQNSLWIALTTGETKFFPVASPLDRTVYKQILFRDLVEFPFTFNTDLMDRFPDKDSLEDAEILSSED